MYRTREGLLHQLRREGANPVDSTVHITSPVWAEYGDALDGIADECGHVVISIAREPERTAPTEQEDRWGCTWSYPLVGLSGQVVGHPLSRWDDMEAYRFPDPSAYTDWEQAKRETTSAHERGEASWGSSEHGFMFLRYTYLRGFDAAMMDVAASDPRSRVLIDGVADFWCDVVRHWIDTGVDGIRFGDDLGLQHTLPISPASWRELFKPAFSQVFALCRSAGLYVFLHTDGWILDIIDDLLECGVHILNPQDLVNGLDELAARIGTRAHIELDIDRQSVSVLGTPAEFDEHIRRCIQTLASPSGGLSLIWGVYPGTPLANIVAGVEAMERYATLHIDSG